jgi:KDO2-lipid IV(A) lauroyltransferase
MNLLYYLILKPLSYLPLAVTYRLSDVLRILLQYVVRYRRRVVEDNISSTLIHLSPAEQRRVVRRFYRHFTDLVFESIRLFAMPQQELQRRMVFTNPEVINDYHDKGQSVIAVAAHYGNWEMFAVATNCSIDHQVVGIYTPLADKFMNAKMQQSRSRFGVHLISKKEVKPYFHAPQHQPFAMFFGADQSPSLNRQAYTTTFLGRETRVQFGVEKYAVEYGLPVVFFELRRVKRGHYEVFLTDMMSPPDDYDYGTITRAHTALLEQQILAEPAYWLWSHKRWKGMD